MSDKSTSEDVFAGANNPYDLFEAWMAEAKASELNDPDAMALATVDADGLPDARMVLLKGIGPRGFVFYTNYESAKGNELAGQPRAALLFHWKSLRRQVRVRGAVERVTEAEADAYFASRARGSRIGAWASDQSRALESRAVLEARAAEVEARFEGQDVPRPPHWSGFRVIPSQIEFWRDGAFRLHDRLRFDRAGEGWETTRLYP